MSSRDHAMKRVVAVDPARGAHIDESAAEALLAHVLSSSLIPAGPATRRRTHRPKALVVLAALVLLLLAAAALAAVGVIRLGAPARPPFALSSPGFGLGGLRPHSARLLPVSVPDPEGGPPWGLRIVSTTRGVGCVEVGRVVNGRLGALGQDGAFHDDGRFHEFPAQGLFPGAVCADLDANGRLFDTVGSDPVSASAAGGAFSGTALVVGVPSGSPLVCPAPDLRQLSYGLLGPDARSISYTLAGRHYSMAASGPEGAYLIVSKPPCSRRPPTSSGSSILPLPWDSPINTITYSKGPVCRIAATRPGTLAGQCKPVGYIPVSVPRPTHAQVAAPIHASVVDVSGAGAAQLGSRRAIRVSFTARIPVTSALTAYELVESTSSPLAEFAETKGDIAVGQTVSWLVSGRLPGIYSGTVTLGIGVKPAFPIYSYSAGPVVGRFRIRVP